jgi:uncharacterized SAM-binding protein YcdF (DUF218 family)
MKKEILIVLGGTNSEQGDLCPISKSRLNYCITKFQKNNSILCTGGWGNHFNNTKNPHAFYAKKYLIKNGIPEESFLDFALSKHTVDDALKIKEICSEQDNNLLIITSDYHSKRVKLIFTEILKSYNMQFFGAPSNLEKEKYAALITHEGKAIKGIIENGLYY